MPCQPLSWHAGLRMVSQLLLVPAHLVLLAAEWGFPLHCAASWRSRVADIHAEKILILDFGSQYTQLIARRIRELHVYCEIHPCTMPFDQVRAFRAKGIVLSGSPYSVEQPGAPMVDPEIFELGVPVLGVCYGLQLMAKLLGGQIDRNAHREDRKSTRLNSSHDQISYAV